MNKIDSEDLELLNKIQSEYIEKSSQLGEIEYKIFISKQELNVLEQEKSKILEMMVNINDDSTKLASKLSEKHGKVSIDLLTGDIEQI